MPHATPTTIKRNSGKRRIRNEGRDAGRALGNQRRRPCRLEIAECQVDQFLFEIRVRRIQKLNRAESRLLFENAARVRERLEVELAVFFADAALPHSADRHVELVKLQERG